jgi:molybdopterin/thiamine biosynthesis adenylyltransferase
MNVSLRVPATLMNQLHQHLFPGDRDEHGAVIGASVLETTRGVRLLAHRLFLAEDGVDYIPGQRGYRMLTAAFVRRCVLACADANLAYLAVHCHGGTDRVAFSPTDLASHERGYPALLDILDGPPAGGLVFAHDAVAGDIWFSDTDRRDLDILVVPDRPMRQLTSAPPLRPPGADDRFDRQARLFGDHGQVLLRRQKVGVIGAGGAGSLLVEYLARLGVGELVIVDPERIDPTNLSRVVGSRVRDTLPCLTSPHVPQPLRRIFERLRTSKVDIAARVVASADSATAFTGLMRDVTDASAAGALVDCDFLFLAADSMQARLVFNALVHQYLIAGTQIGAKAQVDQDTGDVIDLFAVVRPIIPGAGCLWCNELINPAKLQEEATDPAQRGRQRYIDDADVPAPSVITMNAIACSHAANDYLMTVTDLLTESELRWLRFNPRALQAILQFPRRDPDCRECSDSGRLGRGPTKSLPTIAG